MNKRKITLVFVWLSAIATLFSFLAFLNNVVVLWRWAVNFATMTGSKTSESTTVTHGCFTWLDWTAVDLSTVTTFIPFFGFALITLGFWRMYKNTAQMDDDFPFFRAYDRINISLGLIGTLFGIIIIGFYDLDKVTMGDLMMCLHTALFSTLIAVAWVFIIVLMFTKPFMRWWHERLNGIAPQDSFDDHFLERLEQSAASIRHELNQGSDVLKTFSANLSQASAPVFELTQMLKDSTSLFHKGIVEPLLLLQRTQTEQTSALQQLAQTLAQVQTSQQALVEPLLHLQRNQSDQTAAFTHLTQTVAHMQSSQQAFVEFLKEFKTNNDSLQSHLDTIRAEHVRLETLHQQTRKEADETHTQLTDLKLLFKEKQQLFDAQLAEGKALRQQLETTAQKLEAEQAHLTTALEREKQRAEESEKTLAKIKSIF
jgi:hypothetical protein